ncbi:hypothetical protein GCM10009790_22030 [Georgenia ruanii]
MAASLPAPEGPGTGGAGALERRCDSSPVHHKPDEPDQHVCRPRPAGEIVTATGEGGGPGHIPTRVPFCGGSVPYGIAVIVANLRTPARPRADRCPAMRRAGEPTRLAASVQ